MGLPNPSRETRFSGANGDREKNIFPVQLTTSRIGNLTRLIHTLIHCDDKMDQASIFNRDPGWIFDRNRNRSSVDDALSDFSGRKSSTSAPFRKCCWFKSGFRPNCFLPFLIP